MSARICDALDSNGFTFSPATLRAIHGRLFRGLMEEPLLRAALPRLQHLEARVRPRTGIGGLRGLSPPSRTIWQNRLLGVRAPRPRRNGDYTAYIASVADFIARIWQIHPFAEGNTRTVAVFLQQLLHFHGFPQATCSEAFDRSSLQFRNALVRAKLPQHPARRRVPIRRS